MSTPIEIAAVILGLVYLVLVIREQRIGWIAGGLASALFLLVFWRAGLPGQALLQVYYVGVAINGWIYWGREHGVAVSRLGFPGNVLSIGVLAGLCAITLLLRDDGHTGTAWLDTATSWSGVIATWLVASKRVEAWIWWVVIDIASTALYLQAGLLASSALYALYTALAAYGLWEWLRSSQKATKATT
ncbi:MAG: nicotinamide riboside transporter PnuC [Pseudomonadota bacterium]